MALSKVYVVFLMFLGIKGTLKPATTGMVEADRKFNRKTDEQTESATISSSIAVSAERRKESACLGSKVPLNFEHNVPSNSRVIIVKWHFKASIDDDYTLIADLHDGDLKLQEKYRNRVTSENDVLTLKNATEDDDGFYKRERIYDDSEDSFKDYLELTVMLPPDGLPNITHTKTEKSVILTCHEPLFPGYPKSSAIMEDSNGQKQNSLKVTVRDDHYLCCLQGESLKCIDPSRTNHCTIFDTKDNVSERMCKGWTLSIISWITTSLVMSITLVVYVKCIEREGKKRKARGRDTLTSTNLSLRKRLQNAGKLLLHRHFTVLIGLCESFILLISIVGYSCKTEMEQRSYPEEYFIGVGVACSFIMFIAPTLLVSYVDSISANQQKQGSDNTDNMSGNRNCNILMNSDERNSTEGKETASNDMDGKMKSECFTTLI